MTDTATLLAMPLEELRERVELAERMALAARLTPSGAYAADVTAVNTGDATTGTGGTTTRKRRTKAEIDADNAAAQAGNTGGGTATTGTASADELMAAMDPAPADNAAGGELSLDDIGGGDDMLAGFEADLTPAEYREKANAIIADIQAKKDTARLAVAREALVKVGAQKASEVGDDKIKDFYDALPK